MMERANSPSDEALDRPLPRRLASDAKYAFAMRRLPLSVAWFHWRARQLARRQRDVFSLISSTRPADLAILLELARGRRNVVELGTATGWTAIALALADRDRRVATYDPVRQRGRQRYFALVPPRVRDQIRLVAASGSTGPDGLTGVELLYIDSSHDREETIAEVRAWRPALAAGGLIVLDDYEHATYPGVRQAIDDLGLVGVRRGTMFVHEVCR